MKRIQSIFWQTLVIVAVGAGAGFTVNALSGKPLSLVRVPPPPAEEEFQVLTAGEVLNKIETGEAIVLDARSPAEFDAGHILGAANLPEEHFMEYYPEIAEPLPRDFPIIVYCQGGLCDQSHTVLKQLEEFGFKELYLFKDGWEKWKELGFPTE